MAKSKSTTTATQYLVANVAPSQNTAKFEQTADKTFKNDLETLNETITDNHHNKVLIICGPTATGKTKFALEIAKKLNGEIISADSRQVYVGRDITTGKDLPPNIEYRISNIEWRDRKLKYYEINGIKVWLYDVVNPDEPFNVSFWHECAELVINDILSRQKLPIVVGGTGLFIKSLTQDLSNIDVPYNEELRKNLEKKDAKYLFNYLNSINPEKAASLNNSDRHNPRRLIRAIEISVSKKETPFRIERSLLNTLQIGITAPRDHLYRLVNQRISNRISAGASSEDPVLAAHPDKWREIEHGIIRHQLTWFKNQPGITWFDISRPGWQKRAIIKIKSWVKQ